MTATEAPTGPLSGAAFFAKVKPQRRRVRTSLCLNEDLLDAYRANQEELSQERLKHAGTGRLAGGGGKKKTAAERRLEKVEAELEEQIEATQAWFEFIKLPKDDYQKIKDSNPPRKDNEVDRVVGYNRDAVADECVRAGMVDPVFEDCTDQSCNHDACGTWQAFLKIVGPSEWQELRDAASEANGAVVNTPKSAQGSTPQRRLVLD